MSPAFVVPSPPKLEHSSALLLPLVLDAHTIPVPVLVVDRAKCIATANHAACVLLGARCSALVGRQIADVLPGAVITDTEVVLSLARPDGELAYVRLLAKVLPGAVFVFLTDVTTIEMQRLALARVNVDLEQFAYAASHDLQEPLRAIGGLVSEIDKRYRDKATAQDHVLFDTLLQAVERQRAVIRDLLAFSRAQRGESEPMLLSRAVDDALDALASAITQADAVVSFASAAPIWVLFNGSMLGSVLQNLIGNAIKFRSLDRRCEVAISVYTMRDHTVRVTVEDNGIGVPEDVRDQLFQLRRRLHGSQYPGTGVGLAVAQRAVQRAGGTIRHEPVPSGGSRFIFTCRAAP